MTLAPTRMSSQICFMITVFSLTYVTQVVDGCMEAPDAGSERLVYPNLKLQTTILLNWYDSPRLRLSTSFSHIVRVADPVSSLMVMSYLVFPPPTICGSVCFVTTPLQMTLLTTLQGY